MTNSELKSKLSKSVEYLEAELAKIRTGRANPSVLEEISVDAYGGSPLKIKELATITVVDAQNLLVSPWDKSSVGSIAKAVIEAGMNLNPVVDSDVVRVPLPDLTEERRNELAKVVTTKAEEFKGSLRNVRHEAMKDIDKKYSAKEIGEDEKFSQRDEVEKILKDYISQVEELAGNKKADLLKI